MDKEGGAEHGMASYKIPLLVLLILLLVAPNLIAVRNAANLNDATYAENIAYATCFWLFIFAAVPRLWMGIPVAIFGSLWWSIEIVLRLDFEQPITPTSVGMAMDTDTREISEFLTTSGWGVVLPVILLIVAFTALGFYLYRERTRWTHRSRGWTLLAVPLILCAPMLLYLSATNLAATSEPFSKRAGSLLAKFGAVYPLDLPVSIYSIHKDASIIKKLREDLSGFDFQPKLTQASPDTVVLVIGESSRSDRWQIFGYERETTPRLSSVKGLVLFSDVATESTATRYAVPNMISRRPLLQSDGSVASNAEPSILMALKKVGYKTFWISNQGVGGFHESPIAIYAKDADEATYFNPTDFDAKGTYDEVLLAPLRRKLAVTGKKFIVVHTLGSHFDFSHRYPPYFDVYRPSLTSIPAKADIKTNTSLAVQVSNAYDNSIQYTDFVLSQIIEAVAQENTAALVMYISDHGQDVFDERCKAKSITRASNQSFAVPAFLWASEKAKMQMSNRLAALSAARTHPKLSSSLPQTLLDLIGVTTPGWARTPSWFDEKILPRRVFSKGGWTDFDAAVARNPCEIGP